jgi:hypothetical protein
MTTIVRELKSIRPPLKWEPIQGKETTDFIDRKHSTSQIPKSALQDVVFEAQQVLGRCVNPRSPAQGSTGLVVGYVQSGKTISFTTLSALAHDNGFGLIILIAGTLQNLLIQTKKRLEEDLSLNGTGSTRPWLVADSPSLGTPEAKTLETHLKNWVNPNFPSHKRRVCFVIILKQHTRIKKLVKCLTSLDLSSIPTLVIDDESDQATPNTFAAKNRTTGSQKKSTNYREVLTLKEALPHHTYVQYTATPQANLLTAIDDALSPDFGELLKPGIGYVGGATIFKSHSKYAVTIPDLEASATPSTSSGPPATLVKAVRLFLLGACAAEVQHTNANSTMMVHPSQQTEPHNHYLQWLTELIASWRYISSNSALQDDFFNDFQVAYKDLEKTVFENLPTFTQLIENLPLVLQTVQVREVNSTGSGSAPISWSACEYWILVGGAKLDRGFTVEGLTVTYMTRPLATGNADNLQQRARFYGYKQKYLGYCRVYVRETVREAFERYVEHESDVHNCLDETRGQPLKAWVRRFKLHASMQPTRKSVIGIGLQDHLASGWFHPNIAHQADVVLNKKIYTDFLTTIQKYHQGLPAQQAHPELFIDKRNDSSPNIIYEAIPLKLIINDFLIKFNLNDVKDTSESTSLIYTLERLATQGSEFADIFIIGNLPQTRSVTSANKIQQVFSGKSPAGNVERAKLNYGGDRSFIAPERVTLHLREFNIRKSKTDQSFISNVPWYAIHIPENLEERYLLQTEVAK